MTKIERFDLPPESNHLGLDIGFGTYGVNAGKIGVGLYYETFESIRYLSISEAVAMRDWLNEAITAAKEAEKA